MATAATARAVGTIRYFTLCRMRSPPAAPTLTSACLLERKLKIELDAHLGESRRQYRLRLSPAGVGAVLGEHRVGVERVEQVDREECAQGREPHHLAEPQIQLV